MWSIYHPARQQLKAELEQILSMRFIWGVLGFSLGLLVGFLISAHWMVWGILFLLFGLGLFWTYRFLRRGFVCLILCCFCFGALWATGRMMFLSPQLDFPISQMNLVATVEKNVILPDHQILILKDLSGFSKRSDFPEKIQVHSFLEMPYLSVGDRLEIQVSLFPLTGQTGPYAVNFPPLLAFQKIGARGFVKKIYSIQKSDLPLSFFEHLRRGISAHLMKILPDSSARIAIALLTGEQRFILPEQYQLYRQVGLSHVLSVSGFHMALLAGFLFFLIRSLCVYLGSFSLYCNTKKLAAVIAWIGTLGYLILSGCQIPALRSFGMISLVFLGILTDRLSFSYRSLFCVGFILLLFRPENIFSISFQLSFMAVLILISIHQWIQNVMKNSASFFVKMMEFICMNLAITLGLMPLIMWHFNVINPYGVMGNMLFGIFFSFAIMPCLLGGCLLMGYGDFFFIWAGWILTKIEQIAKNMGQWPYSEIMVSAFDIRILFCVIFAIVCLCLFRLWGKLIASVCLVVGVILFFILPKPDLFILDTTMMWQNQGHLFSNTEGQKWLQNQWQKRWGFRQVLLQNIEDVIAIKNYTVTFYPQGCSRADIAFLNHPDHRCSIPTVLLEKGRFYQVSFLKNKVVIQTEQGQRTIIKP